MVDEEVVREWFYRAERDFDSIKILMNARYPVPFEIVCFHCQQAAEKYVKGVMTASDIKVIKTHDIAVLLEMLKIKADVKPIASACEFLTRYAVAYRYPFSPDVDESEARMAITEAQKVKLWAESLVQLDEAAESNGTQDDAAENYTQDDPQGQDTNT